MSTYRDEMSDVARESSWTFFRFLPLIVIAVLIMAALFFGLRSAGLIGGTVVERVVFEQSYQRSEALKSQIATDEAVIMEIERKMMNPSLDEDTRFNLEAHLSAARVRIATAKGRQQ